MSISNGKVISNFLTNGKICQSMHLYNWKNVLVNYSTPIAIKRDSKILVNTAYYTRTTRKIQNELLRQLEYSSIPFQRIETKVEWKKLA
jgi:hypothetical protein